MPFQAGNLKEFVDQEKPKTDETKVIKFASPKAKKFLWGPSTSKQCYLVTISTKAAMKKVHLVKEERKVLEDVGRTLEAKVIEDLICYELDEPNANCFFLVGSNMRERERTELIEFPKTNIEVCAWTSYEMPKIDPNLIKHVFNVIHEARLVKWRGRRSIAEIVDAVIEKVEKLKVASAIT
ncbi:hypothetical protein Acr_00g0074050 [Actinidia rufa]|uniref:Uncharacterized protein n=1 Tax=Actinidia rufa TaxID=165716 RepID=A0A7J0DU17_9ERIC|nr:hypothetical protein Acr_00g0074050 [Actinidia rufa]